jgi:hypothetical protein
MEFSDQNNGNHHRLAAKKISKIDRGRPTTSVPGFVLAVFRARAPAQSSGARARSMERLYPLIIVDLPALVLRIVLVISSDRLWISLVDLGRIFDSRFFSILGRENHSASWKRRQGSSQCT